MNDIRSCFISLKLSSISRVELIVLPVEDMVPGYEIHFFRERCESKVAPRACCQRMSSWQCNRTEKCCRERTRLFRSVVIGCTEIQHSRRWERGAGGIKIDLNSGSPHYSPTHPVPFKAWRQCRQTMMLTREYWLTSAGSLSVNV